METDYKSLSLEASAIDFLQSLRIFMKVSELSSFTRASETLQVGRPQVTLAVRDLELKLGVRLFERTTRRVTLTSEGGAFRKRAEAILADVADASSMFGGTASGLSGKLRINSPSAFFQTGFLDSLKEFSRTYPNVEIVLGITDRANDIVAEEVDCVIRIGEMKDSNLIATRIGAAVMVTCVAPSYLSEFGEPKSLAELANHRSVDLLPGSDWNPQPFSFNNTGELQIATLKRAILVADDQAYVECGVSCFGIIQVPRILVDLHLRHGRLVEILRDLRPTPWMVSVCYANKSYLAPHVRVFVDWVRDHHLNFDRCWFSK